MGIAAIMIILISLVLTALYLEVMTSFLRGWKRLKGPVRVNDGPATRISLVIPVKDEAAKLPGLMECIAAQTYPSALFEVIFVDDFSTDESAAIIRGFERPGLEMKLIRLHEIPLARGSKKAALDKGILAASGDLIITTDADVAFGAAWMERIESHFRSSGSLLMWGPVFYQERGGFWNGFYRLDFTGLVAAAAGAAGNNGAFMCNGANMAFLKEVYTETGGYLGNEQYLSGDDVFLLHKVKERYGPEKVSFIRDRESAVTTEPPHSMAGFINQRSRWASKSSGYADRMARYVTGTVYLAHLMLLVNLAGIFFSPWFVVSFIIMIAAKGISEWSLVSRFCRYYGISWNKLLFWVYGLIYIPYIVLTGILAMTGIYRWKGRRSS